MASFIPWLTGILDTLSDFNSTSAEYHITRVSISKFEEVRVITVTAILYRSSAGGKCSLYLILLNHHSLVLKIFRQSQTNSIEKSKKLYLHLSSKEVDMKISFHASTGSREGLLTLKVRHTVNSNVLPKLLLKAVNCVFTRIHLAVILEDTRYFSPWCRICSYYLDTSLIVVRGLWKAPSIFIGYNSMCEFYYS